MSTFKVIIFLSAATLLFTLQSCDYKAKTPLKFSTNIDRSADLTSHISSVVKAVTSNRMPPKNPLTDCQKAVLQKWFDLGTPDSSEVTVETLPECQIDLGQNIN